MTWNDVLITVVEAIASLIVAVGIPYLMNLLRKRVRNERVNGYISRAEQLIADSVKMVQQTFVDNLKSEGKFDAEAQRIAFNKCKENWLNMISEEAMSAIVDEVYDLDAWIATKIEAAVISEKK